MIRCRQRCPGRAEGS